MRISKTTVKVVTLSFLMLAASGVTLQTRRMLASNESGPRAEVRGISIHKAPGGMVVIDISVTNSVAYRTLQLSAPKRLLVDLKGAREAHLRSDYPVASRLLERVRTSQWKNDPAVVRVVADLKGNPSFNVIKKPSGIRIELKPRAEVTEQDPPPKQVFQVHRFKDLSASLTAPIVPSHDKLVPVANADAPKPPDKKQASTLAMVSGISILPGSQGETTIDIASSKSVPYRVFQLTDPFRLVIDLKDARNASGREVYPVNSPVLKRVRVGQWRPDHPSVVRVVADLEGYPVFDVHAQRPGIRVELRPRYAPGALMRNPFKFKTAPQPPTQHAAKTTSQAAAAGTNSPATAPGNGFAGLKVIGFVEKDGGTRAVISHNSSVYLVPKGGTFENTFIVIAISPDAVEVQNLQTQQTSWIHYAP